MFLIRKFSIQYCEQVALLLYHYSHHLGGIYEVFTSSKARAGVSKCELVFRNESMVSSKVLQGINVLWFIKEFS